MLESSVSVHDYAGIALTLAWQYRLVTNEWIQLNGRVVVSQNHDVSANGFFPVFKCKIYEETSILGPLGAGAPALQSS
jgi:hypothetical protein